MKTYVFDLDGTLCTQIQDGDDYDKAQPKLERINKVNQLFDEGNHIIIFTARGMNRYNGDVKTCYENLFYKTQAQLERWGVKYHLLRLGKPSATYYLDDKGVDASTDEKWNAFFNKMDRE